MQKKVRRKGDAASHYPARRLRLAAAVGNRKRPSSRRPSPTVFCIITSLLVVAVQGQRHALRRRSAERIVASLLQSNKPRLQKNAILRHSRCKRGNGLGRNERFPCRDYKKSALQGTSGANAATIWAAMRVSLAAITNNLPYRALQVQTWLA